MSEQDRVPTPSLLVVLHFWGMWPQLSLHTTSGVGMATAVQVMMKRSPGLSWIIGGGGFAITTEAEIQNKISFKIRRNAKFTITMQTRSLKVSVVLKTSEFFWDLWTYFFENSVFLKIYSYMLFLQLLYIQFFKCLAFLKSIAFKINKN